MDAYFMSLDSSNSFIYTFMWTDLIQLAWRQYVQLHFPFSRIGVGFAGRFPLESAAYKHVL